MIPPLTTRNLQSLFSIWFNGSSLCSRALCNLKRIQSNSQQNETVISSLQYFWNLRNLNLNIKLKWKVFFEGFFFFFFLFPEFVIHCLTHKSSTFLCFNTVHIVKNNLKGYQLSTFLLSMLKEKEETKTEELEVTWILNQAQQNQFVSSLCFPKDWNRL